MKLENMLKQAKKEWDTMQHKGEYLINKSRKEIFTKHGFKNSYFETDTPNEIKNKVGEELYDAEMAIRKQYPYYTDWVEEIVGADLFYNYLLNKINPESVND